MSADLVFDLALDHGRCVGVALPPIDGRFEATIDALAAPLHEAERIFARTLSPLRRRTWVGGRIALREALGRSGLDVPQPIFADPRGAPLVPPGILASVTHKNTCAAALVTTEAAPGSHARRVRRIGVDLEHDVLSKHDIAHHVLSDEEHAELRALDAEARGRAVLLRFSAKEALYKALDPFVLRYVAFGEVSLSPRADGRADVRTHLRPDEGAFVVESRWLRVRGMILTTAEVMRAATA